MPDGARAWRRRASAAALLVCPPGRYRERVGVDGAEATLRRHWQRLQALGYRPRSLSPAAAERSVARGFVTFESALWPRPAHCNVRRRGPGPHPIVDEPPGTCEPAGVQCDKYRVSRRYKFVWHHVWKGGTTALSPYLSCNMDAMPAAGLLRQLPAPIPGYLQVGSAREPLQRFVSAFQEVYLRLRIHSDGTRCVHRNVPWLRHASAAASGADGGCAAATEALNGTALLNVLRRFVADLECATRFPAVEHLYSQ